MVVKAALEPRSGFKAAAAALLATALTAQMASAKDFSAFTSKIQARPGFAPLLGSPYL